VKCTNLNREFLEEKYLYALQTHVTLIENKIEALGEGEREGEIYKLCVGSVDKIAPCYMN